MAQTPKSQSFRDHTLPLHPGEGIKSKAAFTATAKPGGCPFEGDRGGQSQPGCALSHKMAPLPAPHCPPSSRAVPRQREQGKPFEVHHLIPGSSSVEGGMAGLERLRKKGMPFKAHH
eukprot:1161356-Pelagomonas_calceolata.AAC.3